MALPPVSSLAILSALLPGLSTAAGASSCKSDVAKRSQCALEPYAVRRAVKSPDDCCGLCEADPKCKQWTLHGLLGTCALSSNMTAVKKGPTTFFSTCGIKGDPPSPSPSPVAKGDQWAVIAAGSAGFFNYRHQADACHAYQIMKKSGIPEDHIILMMQDDVAGSDENPFPGKLFNRPGTDVPDVYEGCKIDYRGSIVTAKLFLSVITGDATGVPDGSKVLKSGPNDRVFLNFVDHGGVGIIAFPNGPVLHVAELKQGIETMQAKNMFKELVFYMEACESGSMFPGLPTDHKIFAVTAANAKESSWGFYCMPNDKVNGKHIGSCLGDLFSIAWMEDTDLAAASETIATQVAKVTKRTTKSHVTTFGDTSLESEAIGSFEASSASGGILEAEAPAAPSSAIDARDVAVHSAFQRWSSAEGPEEKAKAWRLLHGIVAAREADEQLFRRIAAEACSNANAAEACAEGLLGGRRAEMTRAACHARLVRGIHGECPRRAEHDAGGWNDFNMKFSQVLVNMCELAEELQMSEEALEQVVVESCMSERQAQAAAGVVV